MTKTIAVIGATPRRNKFANKCIRAYQRAGWAVYPVNPNYEDIEGLQCYHDITHVPQPVERISMYVGPAIGKGLLDQLCQVQHQELWFNPGSADAELVNSCRKLGLNPVQSCSIVDIGMSPSMFPDA